MLLGTGKKCGVVGIEYQNFMHDSISETSQVQSLFSDRL
jgi:hypothetical protein